MSGPVNYSHTFKLDRALLNECFEQSMDQPVTWFNYRKALVFVFIGMALLMATEVDGYLASFIVGLGVVEALSVKYQQAWWVTRQLFGRSGNSDVTVGVDINGVHINSAYVSQSFVWQDIDEIIETKKGLLLMSKGIKHYLSASVLSDEAQQFMLAQTSHQTDN
ncbi:YcxB family protein [Thalassotalea sp. M1531]|uniref:YcxB family protein n=1 Tax=Thalassotalea algicola TaxID=2716224 RepID=A0A7Y0LD06_9GAMM|nr:YcxB family protein [Thalassotalea algicola]NMP32032.1 YcxB family protein [Thalassotalea algicola]